MLRLRSRTPASAARLTLTLALISLVVLACDTEAGTPSIGRLLDDTPTATYTVGQAPVEALASATPAIQSPTTRPPASPDKPRVLWMLRDHGGANLAIVRFAANTEVTAVLSLAGAPGQPAGVDPQTVTAFATEHTISIPLGLAPGAAVPASLTLEVTDRMGAKATATLEYGDTIVGTQYWARAEDARPAFTWTAPFEGAATWTNLVDDGARPSAGSVQLFGKRAACTTAEQCTPAPLATFTEDTRTPLEGAEAHSIPVELPQTPDQDFQLLYTATFDAAEPVSLFYQLDIPRSAAVAGRN